MPPACRFSVCICTRDRPADLRRALRSLRHSSHPVSQIVVADDSTDGATRALVAAEFAEVCYLEGPRAGLGANRNTALGAVTGTHVLFLDDDAVLAPGFLAGVAAELARPGAAAETIVTGAEINHGARVVAHKPSFLGHLVIGYRPAEAHESIVINATVFPAGLFARLRFDPSLVYGCDEIDIAVRAVRLHGCRIRFVPELANYHYPSTINRAYYAPFTEASRIYVQFKRFYWVERKKPKAAAFLVLAYAHVLLHHLSTRGLAGIAAFATTVGTSQGYIRACCRDRARYV